MPAPEIRKEPGKNRVAIKTEIGDPIREWFVFDTRGGGHYAPGTRYPDDVTDWPPYIPPEEPETGEES